MISLIGETKKNNAFTLIEVLLVLTIVGIILALAVPNYSKGYTVLQLNKTTDDLLSVSRWAQAMAIGQERVYALSLAGDHRSYRLERLKSEEDLGALGSDPQNAFEPVNGALGRIHAIPDAIRLEADIDRIEFYPDGTIDPVTIHLNSPEQKTALSSAQVRGMMMKVDDE